MTPSRFVAPVLTSVIVVLVAACGANASPELDLTQRGEEGRRIANSNGCGSCHGNAGQGGVGPAFVGLYGSQVELDDGTIVTADEEYLTVSITDPGAQRVAGYRLPMPSNGLSDDEVAAVVDYIRELADADGGA